MGELGDLVVDLSVRGERTAAVYRALLEAVRGGRIGAGERLPATRALASDLGVSRTTVSAAYERLVAEGYLAARVGAGTFVADDASPARRRPRRTAALAVRTGWAGGGAEQPTSGGQPKPDHDFRVGIPDATLFPFDTWRRLMLAELRVGAHDLGTYADPAGLAALRAAIARQVGRSRGVTAHADEVLITSGTQQGLDLVARVLVAPGDVVAVEDPGYPAARAVFASHGARVVPVPVDGEGLVVDQLPVGARVVFTTPAHQFPTGPPLSLARRRALLDFASQHRCAVVEDDYDSEFRFTERPLETLFSLDTAGRVLYLGTFSKTLLPGLRTGYLVAPAPLQAPLRAALQLAVGHHPLPEQAALARFLDDGLFAGHLRRARAAYGTRRDQLKEGVWGPLADHLELVPCQAGLHVTTLLRDRTLDDRVVARAAADRGVAVDALSSYAVADGPRGLVLGYGAAVPTTIRPGLQRLADLFAELPTTTRPGRRAR